MHQWPIFFFLCCLRKRRHNHFKCDFCKTLVSGVCLVIYTQNFYSLNGSVLSIAIAAYSGLFSGLTGFSLKCTETKGVSVHLSKPVRPPRSPDEGLYCHQTNNRGVSCSDKGFFSPSSERISFQPFNKKSLVKQHKT